MSGMVFPQHRFFTFTLNDVCFAIQSKTFLYRLADRWPDSNFRADFAIDPKHEVGLLLS